MLSYLYHLDVIFHLNVNKYVVMVVVVHLCEGHKFYSIIMAIVSKLNNRKNSQSVSTLNHINKHIHKSLLLRVICTLAPSFNRKKAKAREKERKKDENEDWISANYGTREICARERLIKSHIVDTHLLTACFFSLVYNKLFVLAWKLSLEKFMRKVA